MGTKLFVLPVVMAVLALSACSDPAAYHADDAEIRAMAPPPIPAKQVADAGFCRGAAQQTALADFDDATRARLYAVNYRQCMALFGPALRLADLGGGDAGY